MSKSRRCLSEAQVNRIDNMLAEVRSRDNDSEFDFIEILNAGESKKALDKLLKSIK